MDERFPLSEQNNRPVIYKEMQGLIQLIESDIPVGEKLEALPKIFPRFELNNLFARVNPILREENFFVSITDLSNFPLQNDHEPKRTYGQFWEDIDAEVKRLNLDIIGQFKESEEYHRYKRHLLLIDETIELSATKGISRFEAYKELTKQDGTDAERRLEGALEFQKQLIQLFFALLEKGYLEEAIWQ